MNPEKKTTEIWIFGLWIIGSFDFNCLILTV